MLDIQITRLRINHAEQLSNMLLQEDKNYSQYFHPFAYTQASIQSQLAHAKQDRYWGIFHEEAISGFFMLRGFDSGYQRPSFGVYIAQHATNQGLATLALRYSMSWCLSNNINKMMLKVHPDNIYARKTYEKAGFIVIDTDNTNNNLVMEKTWIK